MLFGEGWLTLKGRENLIDLTRIALGNDSTQIPIVSERYRRSRRSTNTNPR